MSNLLLPPYCFGIIRLPLLLLAFVLAGCNGKPSTSCQNQPSPALRLVLQQFIEADTLQQHPKFYAAFIAQDSAVGNLSVYLLDAYNATGDASICPSATWAVDKKVFFVYSGLESITSACDTSHYSLIEAAHRANNGKIWSPPLRCWKVNVRRRQIVNIDKEPELFYPFGANLGSPPPFPKIIARP